MAQLAGLGGILGHGNWLVGMTDQSALTEGGRVCGSPSPRCQIMQALFT